MNQTPHITSLSDIKLNGSRAAGREFLCLCTVNHEVAQSATMRSTSRGRPGVNPAFSLSLTNKPPSAFTLMGQHRHSGVSVSKGFENVIHRRCWGARKLFLSATPERLSQWNLFPWQIWEMSFGGFNWCIT